MSGLLAYTKLALAAPRLSMAVRINSMAIRGYASKKLFIGNLPWGTTDDEISEVLSQYGSFKDFHVPKDQDGRTKGFAFVELEEDAADKVIQEVNGREFNGRELRVSVANPRPDRSERPPRNDFRGEFRPRRDFNRNNSRDRNGGERQFRPRRESNRDYSRNQDGDDRYFRRPQNDGADRE
ncbi:hypothetical protein BX616_009652 [Lobosporangium transversale]|uniref:RRM domain-containing protein n=1 Tax=Lobosporangium transversale TaxID=64571 RepID=A0A1Y2GP02_9FUNG|nr:hypothetical protein BCR41DRAFT_356020 [Lobosporangium transversale]KAF9913746.1 hypothetical protein BX616_009652 [Lobosporangium transversale]ORZ12994.1 hypothetical protein BCR41DRAFT_356020 [Lobosporangium transversale]|eukprot:XP_021880343.1 hypothetical protein BCR41DRAFT_356020 [Lobosporangium transversale]